METNYAVEGYYYTVPASVPNEFDSSQFYIDIDAGNALIITFTPYIPKKQEFEQNVAQNREIFRQMIKSLKITKK